MRSIAPPDSAVQSSGALPWRALLHARGLSDATIDHFGLTPDRTGWLYPVAPDTPARRWKAFPNRSGAKYRWKPSLPPGVRFYDPHGDLDERVTQQGGALILAAGEPDVWALHEAGLFHATATMHGEGTIPPWFVDELIRLGVTRLLAWPDRDPAGLASAFKLRQALAGTGIALDLFALPYPLDSKADINRTLLDVGADRLGDVLRACPRLVLPDPTPDPVPGVVFAPRNVPDDAARLYERWCGEVEAEAVRAWSIAPPNAKHLSRKNFRSPYRQDRRPSAQWNYTAHGFRDYATGEFSNTHTVAGLLGLPPWSAYKAAHAAPLPRPDMTAPAADAPRVWAAGVPQHLVWLLLNLHRDRWLNVRTGTLPNFGAAAAAYTVWHELVAQGALKDDEPVTAVGLARLSAAGRGLSKDTAANGLRRLAEWQLIEFVSLAENQSPAPGTQSRLIAAEYPPGPGRTGERYRLRPLDAALDDFLARLEPLLYAVVLVRDFPDLPLTAQALRQPLGEYGLTAEHLAAIDEASQPLYQAHQALRAQAAAVYQQRRGVFRAKYGYAALRAATPLVLPPGARSANAAAFRDAVDEADLDRQGGVRTDRHAAARRVGRGMGSHRASCDRRGVASIPQFEEHALDPRADVLAQCQALDGRAFRRGAMELVAASGSSVRVSARHAEQFDYAGWVAGRAGEAPVVLRIQRPSLEKRRAQATEAEVAAAGKVRTKQRAASRRRWQAAPAVTQPKPKSLWPADYLLRQGELRAEVCGVRALADGRFVTPEGEVLPRDPAALWRGLAGALRPGPDAERSGSASPAHHDANQARPCVLCGAPGEALHWTGWYCAAHYALPLDEKRRRWQRGQDDENIATSASDLVV